MQIARITYLLVVHLIAILLNNNNFHTLLMKNNISLTTSIMVFFRKHIYMVYIYLVFIIYFKEKSEHFFMC